MDHLFLLQFACFLFMLFNAFTLAVTRLQTRWLNPRYERTMVDLCRHHGLGGALSDADALWFQGR